MKKNYLLHALISNNFNVPIIRKRNIMYNYTTSVDDFGGFRVRDWCQWKVGHARGHDGGSTPDTCQIQPAFIVKETDLMTSDLARSLNTSPDSGMRCTDQLVCSL